MADFLESTAKAHRELQAKIEQAVYEAFNDGKDFAVEERLASSRGPVDLLSPCVIEISVKGGPIAKGADMGPGFIYYRKPEGWPNNLAIAVEHGRDAFHF